MTTRQIKELVELGPPESEIFNMTDTDKMNNKIRNRTMDMTLTYKCKDCGKDVEIKLGEIFYLDDSGLRVGQRCKDCRDKKNEAFEKRG